MSAMSLLAWLPNVDHSKANPKEYRTGNTLVGLKVVSLFNTQFFFQYILLHKPHTRFSEL